MLDTERVNIGSRNTALIFPMYSNCASVAPFAAPSVACFSCSGVRPKLQVNELPIALPPLAMAQEPALICSSARAGPEGGASSPKMSSAVASRKDRSVMALTLDGAVACN
jgi:hypothetical protein